MCVLIAFGNFGMKSYLWVLGAFQKSGMLLKMIGKRASKMIGWRRREIILFVS